MPPFSPPRPRVVFMGTPRFAVASLQVLLDLDYVVAAVYTAPDKPAGRRLELAPSAVKLHALACGLPILQPRSLRTEAATAELQALAPDLVVVAAYGKILPPAILAIPARGCLNVHASYLPRHRGAAPIQGAILAGDPETGVTIMVMDEGLDTGPVVLQRLVPLPSSETTGTLTDRLAAVGAGVLAEALPRWFAGHLAPMPQIESLATMTTPVRKSDGELDWTRPAAELERAVRAFQPWPGAFSTLADGRRLTIVSAAVADGDDGPAGSLRTRDGEPVVATASGGLLLRQVQLPGKRVQPGREWLNGQRGVIGTQLVRASPRG